MSTSVRYTNNRPAVSTAEAMTLPAGYYTDPEMFQRELRAVHHDMWLSAGRTEQLPEAGSYFLVRFAGVNIIVVRDKNGEIAAFHNTCRHRGTQLCKEQSGKVAGKFRCPYHAWTYELDGRLTGAPNMEKVEGFRMEDYPLGAVATAIWDGHIFINMAERPIPFSEHLAGLDKKFAPWGMADLKLVERRVYNLKANWKLILQNYSECMHCPIAHPQLNKLSHYMSGDNEPPQPTYLGGSMDLRPGVKTMTTDGQSNHANLPGHFGGGQSARLLLRDPAEFPVEPRPRLHDDLPAVADGRGSHRRRMRVAFPSRCDCEAGLRSKRRGGFLGNDQPAGLGIVGPGPGRDFDLRLSARTVFQPRGTADRT